MDSLSSRHMALLLAILVAGAVSPRAAAQDSFAYRDGRGMVAALKQVARDSDRAELREIGRSAGEQTLQLLEIAPRRGAQLGPAEGGPAVLVVGDPLGTCPLASEAALRLAQTIAAATDGPAAAVRWYVLPFANPDGFDRYHRRPLLRDGRNATPLDDDRDGYEAEDPPDDLDGDRIITTMLVAEPGGAWLLDGDPPLPRRADPAAGETGRYTRHIEGDDDDGDGLWNEDLAGGTVMGKNFPHGFEHWTTDAGPWAASEPESRALLAFAFDHPDIALVLVLGESNTLRVVPEADAALADRSRDFAVSRYLARRAGVKPGTLYDLDTILDLARDALQRPELTEEDALSYVVLPPAERIHPGDVAWWRAINTRYLETLTTAGLDAPRLDSLPSPPGSVEGWAYYQFGVPTFAVDFWSLPVPVEADTVGADTNGAERRSAPPEPNGAEKKAARRREAVATFAREHPELTVVHPWTDVTLAGGRRGRVGGIDPHAATTPPPAWVDSLLAPQLPFLLELPGWLPVLDIGAVTAEAQEGGTFLVTLHLANTGRLPYPTAHGARTRRPPPVVVTLDGADVLEGRARRTVRRIAAGSTAEVRWLVRGPTGTRVTLVAEAPSLGRLEHPIVLGGEGDRR